MNGKYAETILRLMPWQVINCIQAFPRQHLRGEYPIYYKLDEDMGYGLAHLWFRNLARPCTASTKQILWHLAFVKTYQSFRHHAGTQLSIRDSAEAELSSFPCARSRVASTRYIMHFQRTWHNFANQVFYLYYIHHKRKLLSLQRTFLLRNYR